MNCGYCKVAIRPKTNNAKRYKRRFCDMSHYHQFRAELRPKHEHERWDGGVSQTEAHRRWKAKNPERMVFLKTQRYAREQGAIGSHTFEQWIELKCKFQNRCAKCFKKKPLTKDHIVPLSKGGSNFIKNIQPLCRNCNSRKWAIYENPELLKP